MRSELPSSNTARSLFLKRALIFAVLLHLGLLVPLIFHWQSKSNIPAGNTHETDHLVQATAVDQKMVEQQIRQIKQREWNREQLVKRRQEQLQRIRQESLAAEQQKLKEAQALKQLQAQKLLALKQEQQRKQQAEQNLKELKELQMQKLQAKKQLADIQKKKRQEQQEKKTQAEKPLFEKKSLPEQDKPLKKAAAAESKPAATTNSTEDKQAEAKSADQAVHSKDLAATAQQESLRIQGLIRSHTALILEAIGRRWVIPEGVEKDLSCEVLIRLAPGGVVLDVQLLNSSGHQALDQSAVAAIFQSSPLPVPPDEEAFNYFRTLRLTVRPEGFLNG